MVCNFFEKANFLFKILNLKKQKICKGELVFIQNIQKGSIKNSLSLTKKITKLNYYNKIT